MKLLILLLPAMAVASIEFKISGEVFFEPQYLLGGINIRRSEKRGITPEDQKAFHIQDKELNSAIKRYNNGIMPDYVYLTRHSPWGDLYRTNRWDPVEVMIRPETPELLDITEENVVLFKRIYTNPQSAPMEIHLTKSATTYNTITALWTNPEKVLGGSVNFKFDLQIRNDVVDQYFSCVFGYNRRMLFSTVRGASVSYELAPRQNVTFQQEVNKGTLKFRIPYKVWLSGVVATLTYDESKKDYRFAGLDINQILEASRLNRTLTVYQWVSYEVYYEQHLRILNAEDGSTELKSFAPEGGSSSGVRRKAAAARHAADTGKKIMKKKDLTFEFTEEDLKAIAEEIVSNQLDEESSESTESVETHADDATQKH